ncbi:uncharacterized protein MONBRDRAFT_37900 [Monosiga brevicollis MX1]|uniref:Uncharacterized protein n=1 Tax=Monosiga brevicollis TaxID=81824 RepID=A9V4H8_MONBE|nr:uncharacterized protein MONBRDRAFT_37900 [Monosiga brevicollis MX1]EDQ87713.1 predicted protein [Monosiga brevicollis MX1]|eukprot:XP_001747633.1 hypothetical protein [Monosiga brevicollis MX1]
MQTSTLQHACAPAVHRLKVRAPRLDYTRRVTIRQLSEQKLLARDVSLRRAVMIHAALPLLERPDDVEMTPPRHKMFEFDEVDASPTEDLSQCSKRLSAPTRRRILDDVDDENDAESFDLEAVEAASVEPLEPLRARRRVLDDNAILA